MRSPSPSRIVPLFLMALMLISSMPVGAFHLGTTVDQETPDPPSVSAPEEPPETGFVEPDQRLSELYSQTTDAIDSFEADAQQALGSLAGQAPVRPIDLLRDDVEPGERHGGIGPWDDPAPWHRANASERDWTWRFGNETTGEYPSTNGALLLSPVIDLSTLGPYTDFVPTWRQNGAADLFTLFLVHRFELAEGRGRGLDGGRVEVFMNLTEEGYENGGTILQPATGPTYEDFVQALGGEGFSGSSNWTVSSFDLSPYAGHRIRVGLRVATVPFSEDTERFEDEGLFASDRDRGWLVDQARITAPAIANNVQVEKFRSPQRAEDEPMPQIVPGQTPDVRAPIVNLGANAETVDVRYRVTAKHPDARNGPGQVLHEHTETVELVPGEVHDFRDRGWTPERSGRDATWLGLEAEVEDPSSGQTDRWGGIQPAQQWQPVRVHAEPDLDHRLTVDPTIGQPGEERTIRYVVRNDGQATGFARAKLVLEHRSDPDDDWRNRTDEFLGDAWGPRFVTVPAIDTKVVSWQVTPPDRGSYRLSLNSTAVDPNGTTINAEFYADTGADAWSLLDPLRSGQQDPACGAAWDCRRPADEPIAGVRGSPVADAHGAYWVSPSSVSGVGGTLGVPTARTELVGTPPPGVGRDCRGADDLAQLSPVECQRRALDLLDGVEPGPGGPVETVAPGYMDLELHARYRPVDVPLDAPPRIHVEMAYNDPFHAYLSTFREQRNLNSPQLEDAQELVLGDPVHVTIELPPSNGTADDGMLGWKQGASWREVTVDLDERLEAATGVKNAWDLSLEEVRVIGPSSTYSGSDSLHQLLLDDLNVSGIPVEDPTDRLTILQTTGDASEAIGTWTCRVDKNPAPRPSVATSETGCGAQGQVPPWKSEDPGGSDPNTEAGDVWTFEEADGAWRYQRVSSNPEDARLVTPPVELPGQGDPQLVLEHQYSTPASDFGHKWAPGQGIPKLTYQLETVYAVEVQYKRGDGWSPFYLLEPEGGHPTPEMTTPGGLRRIPLEASDPTVDGPSLRPGGVFYWPNGSVEIPSFIEEFSVTRQVDGSPLTTDVFPLRQAPGMGPPVDLDGRTVRFAFEALQGNAIGSDEGTQWHIRDLQIWNRTPLARNVRVVEAEMQVEDGESRAELGPGAEVPVDVLVENDGRLGAGPVEVTLVIEQGGEVEDRLTQRLERLPPGANRTRNFRWTVDERATEDDTFNLTVVAKATDHRDLSTIDNSVNVGTVDVRIDPGVRVRTSVTPSIGTADRRMTLDTGVENAGNTPLEGVAIDRRIWRLGTSQVLVREDHWTVSSPVQPSERPVSLRTEKIESEHEATPADADPDRWTPSQPGSYRVQTEIEATSRAPDGGRTRLTDTHDRVVQVLEPVFRDGFEGDREGGRPGVPWTTTGGDAWEKRDDAGFRSSTSWWVGAGDQGYNHEMDTALVSPPIDLSSAKSAFLTLATNYSTEPFYDGATVELTTDGGQTWIPLAPGTTDGVTGYPGALSPANPAGARDEEGRPIGGFSGSPSADERLDGWTLHTFPLSQVDPLTGREELLDAVPSKPDNGSLQKLGFQYTRPSWELGTGPDAKRFLVQNLTEPEPSPITGGTMWYTGPVGRASEVHTTRLELDLPDVSVSEDEMLQVRFEDWRPGVTPRDRTGTGACYNVTVGADQYEPDTPAVPLSTDWTPRWINVTGPSNPDRMVFEFDARPWNDGGAPACMDADDETSPADHHASDVTDSRGWAIDNVSVRIVDGEDTQQVERVVTSDLSERDDAWEVIAPSEGATVRWDRAHGPEPVEGGWSSREGVSNGADDDGVAWTLEPPGDQLALPANQQSRLVTPTVDLRGIGQRDVSLELTHDYRFQARGMTGTGTPETIEMEGSPETQSEPTLVEGGVVEVQVYNQTTQSFEPWRTLFREPVDLEDRRIFWGGDCSPSGETPKDRCEIQSVNASTMLSQEVTDAVGYPFVVQRMGLPFEHTEMNFTWGTNGELRSRAEPMTFLFTGNERRKDSFDLSWLTGKRFRLGFHAWANPHGPTITEEPEHWTIRDARVVTESFTADTVQTRVHVGSDASIAGDHVAVDDVSVSQVSYDRNLELEIDEGDEIGSVEPGSVTWINGTVQNRGRAARDGFAVRVTAPDLPMGLQRAPGRPGADGEPGDLLPVPTTSLSVGPAGTPQDTVSFAIPVLVPEDAPPAQGTLRVRLVSMGDSPDASRVRPLTDEVSGNKLATLPVSVGSVASAELTLSAVPSRPRTGEATSLAVRVANTGTEPLSPSVHVNVSGPAGRRILQTSDEISIAPGESEQAESSVTPATSGLYQIDISLVSPSVSRQITETLPVNASAAPVSTSWETGDDWLAWTTEAVDEQCPTPEPADGQAEPSPGPANWTRRDSAGVSGGGGLVFGVRDVPTRTPPEYQDAGLVSPTIDLAEVEDPLLSIVHRPHFYTAGAGAVVEVQVLNRTTGDPIAQASPEDNCRGRTTITPNEDGWFLLRPEGGYNQVSVTEPGDLTFAQGSGGSGSTTPAPPSALSPLGGGHPIIGGASDTWQQTNFELDEQSLTTPDGRIDLEEHLVKLRLRATTRERLVAGGEGWNIDSLVVGSSGLDVKPDRAERTLVDGARKTLELDVTNPGTRRDTYQVAIAEEGTTLPMSWVDFSTPQVTIPAGETRPLNATLQVPVSENNQRATYQLTLVLTSPLEPALLDFVTYTIHVVPSLHANLAPRLSVDGDQVEVGETTLISTTVTNTGLSSNTRAKARIWVEPPGGERRTIAEREIPPIEPSRGGKSESVSLTVPWTASEEQLGEHEFGVTVDPENRIVEFNESDNQDTESIDVIPLQRPDLVVEPSDLRVLHVDGSPLEAADPGDLVQALVSVHNEGNEPAQRVKVSLAMGPEPVAQRVVERLPPGTTRTFPFTVFAPGNTTVLSLDATTLDAELDEENNGARVTLPVRRADVSITPTDGRIELGPGNETRQPLDLVNSGSQTTLVRLASADPAFSVETSDDEILLEPGEKRTIDARVAVDPSVAAGSTEIPVRVTDVGEGRSATLEVPVTVHEETALSVDVPDSRAVGPNPFTLPVTVENAGNVPVTPDVRVTPPEGWGQSSRSTRLLEPGEAWEITEDLIPPNGTRAGTYPVGVTVATSEGPSADVVSQVQVKPTARADVSSRLASAGTHPVVHEVELENTGNVPSIVALDVMEAPIGWTVETRDAVARLEPGEDANATLVFSKASEDAPQIGSFVARTRLSPETPVDQASLERTFTGALNALPPDVAVSSVEPTPHVGVEEGQAVRYDVTVENRGLGPAAPVPVRLYQNDELVDAGEIASLPAGGEATLNFTISADEGLQTVVASADPHGRLVDRDPSNNAVGRELVAEGRLMPRGVPGPGGSLAVLGLAALAILFRRRGET